VYALNRTPIIGALFRYTALLPLGRALVKRGLTSAYAPDTVRRDHLEAARALWLRPSQVAATVWDTRNLDRELREASTRYAGIRVPVIIICGARDQSLPESQRLAIAIPGAQLVVVPNIGHEAQLTRTAIVLDAIRHEARAPLPAPNQRS